MQNEESLSKNATLIIFPNGGLVVKKYFSPFNETFHFKKRLQTAKIHLGLCCFYNYSSRFLMQFCHLKVTHLPYTMFPPTLCIFCLKLNVISTYVPTVVNAEKTKVVAFKKVQSTLAPILTAL